VFARCDPVGHRTLHAAAGEPGEYIGACLRRLQAAERNATKAASPRATQGDRGRLRSGEEWSDLKRTESRTASGGSLTGWRQSARRPSLGRRRSVAGALICAPSLTVCRRQAKPAPTVLPVLSQGRDEARAASNCFGAARSAALGRSRGAAFACLPIEPCRERSEVFGGVGEAVHATERTCRIHVASQAPFCRTSAAICCAAPGAQERAPLAEHKSRLLDGR